jgi:Uma2 family endonuclease
MSIATTHPKILWEPGAPLPRGLRMSEDDFLEWAKDIRAEWVEGEVIVMAPANFEHTDINLWLLNLLSLYVQRKDLGIVGFDFYVHLHVSRLHVFAFYA